MLSSARVSKDVDDDQDHYRTPHDPQWYETIINKIRLGDVLRSGMLVHEHHGKPRFAADKALELRNVVLSREAEVDCVTS